MPALHDHGAHTGLATAERVRRWWWRLNPQRQDRFAVLAPLAAVLLFLAAIIASFGYLRLEEIDREHEAVRRDVEYTQQRLRLRLLERQEQLMRIARDISNQDLEDGEFHQRSENLINQYPELERVSWIDERRRVRASFAMASLQLNQRLSLPETLKQPDTQNIFNLARETQQPIYSQLPSAAHHSCSCMYRYPTARGVSSVSCWANTRSMPCTGTVCPPKYRRATRYPCSTTRV